MGKGLRKIGERKRTFAFRGRILKKVTSFSDGSEGLSRKAQAALSFELKETFKLKDVLHLVGIPESSYHYHIKKMKKENPDQEMEELFNPYSKKITEIMVTVDSFRIKKPGV